MIPIGGNYTVLRLPGRNQPGTDSFLTCVKVQETTNLALLVKRGGPFFQMPDYHHLAISLKILVLIHQIRISPSI
jgi:hypothetical protein